jgi:hypothetical protein
MSKWRIGFDPDLVAKRINETKTVSNGKVEFSGFDHTELVAILNTMIEFREELPETEARKILNQATFAAGLNGDITAESIIKHVKRLEREYLRKPYVKYKLLTDISTSPHLVLPGFNILDASISINPRLNKLAWKSRSDLLQNAKHSISCDLPANYSSICVSVKARSPFEAADLALDKLDFLRGIWNLWKNRGQWMRISSGKRSPVNVFVLGPIHTLHDTTGKATADAWWFEPNYQGPISVFSDRKNVGNMLVFTRNFRELFNKSNYKSEIAAAMLRYVRALDSTNWNDAYLRLWGVLEFITGTQLESYKVTVRRAAFMFTDRDYAIQVLSHLRDYRNKSVHTGIESGEIESLMYQLKRVVERLIEFHVGNAHLFSSIIDAAELMDLPSSRKKIDRLLERLQFARKFVKTT